VRDEGALAKREYTLAGTLKNYFFTTEDTARHSRNQGMNGHKKAQEAQKRSRRQDMQKVF
jgi:hypothetical protein